MFNILKDAALNESLNKDGYAKLPFLNAAEIARLNELYHKWHPQDPTAFYRSFFSNDPAYKSEVQEEIFSMLVPKLKNHVHDFLPTGGMFVVKPSGQNQDIQTHQDWTFVDEDRSWSLNFWLPLQDVDVDQGAIKFLKGSHHFIPTVRGFGTPDLYDTVSQEIDPYIEPMPLRAGEGVLFFHSILHGSTENKMDHARVCVGLSLIEADAPIYFYSFRQDENLAYKYNVHADFYMDFVMQRDQAPAQDQLVAKIAIPQKRISYDEIRQKMSMV